MKRLVITTRVEEPVERVFAGFTRDLFLRLNPPFPPVTLERFDGMTPGDEVHLLLRFPVWPQRWVSRITERVESDAERYFVDEGVTLPFFLKRWHHRHVIRREGEGSLIIDDITFATPHPLLDILLYPALFLQFLYRKPVYRRVFRKG